MLWVLLYPSEKMKDVMFPLHFIFAFLSVFSQKVRSSDQMLHVTHCSTGLTINRKIWERLRTTEKGFLPRMSGNSGSKIPSTSRTALSAGTPIPHQLNARHLNSQVTCCSTTFTWGRLNKLGLTEFLQSPWACRNQGQLTVRICTYTLNKRMFPAAPSSASAYEALNSSVG